jgi:hypothetical protein
MIQKAVLLLDLSGRIAGRGRAAPCSPGPQSWEFSTDFASRREEVS